jgi:hypothetical protein
MKKYMRFCVRSDWVGNPRATLVTMVTYGIFSDPDNSDVTAAIRKGQGSNSGESAIVVLLCVHLLTYFCSFA